MHESYNREEKTLDKVQNTCVVTCRMRYTRSSHLEYFFSELMFPVGKFYWWESSSRFSRMPQLDFTCSYRLICRLDRLPLSIARQEISPI